MTHINWRDDMCWRLMGMRQLVRDLPDHEVPTAAQMLVQLEIELKKLCQQGKVVGA